MDWSTAEFTLFALLVIGSAIVGTCALLGGVMVVVSRPLVGFRVPFRSAFKAAAATMVVTVLLRAIGAVLASVAGPLVGTAVVLAGAIYFLAWYLEQYVPRPDGTPLGPQYGYRLASVNAIMLVIINLVALGLVSGLR